MHITKTRYILPKILIKTLIKNAESLLYKRFIYTEKFYL